MDQLKTKTMTRWALGMSAALGMTLAACGDGPICKEQVAIAVTAPVGVVGADLNPDVPGIQVDVVVEHNALTGVPLLLTVTDAEGNQVFPSEDTDASSTLQLSDGSGTAIFKDVTVPAGALTFSVTAEAGACGKASQADVVQIAVGDDCDLALDPLPRANEFYAPREVYLLADDQDPAIDDLQVEATVTGLLGFTVQVVATDDEGNETILHTIDAMGDAPVATTITLGNGPRNVFARCIPPVTDPGNPTITDLETTTSVPLPLYVDTIAPTCTFAAPIAGSSITQAADKDGDISNGLQYDLVVDVDDNDAGGADVEGEIGGITYTSPTNQPSAGSGVVTNGTFTVEATFTDTGSLPWTLGATVSDHAGNPCDAQSDLRVVYGGCAITATSAPTNTDADPSTSGVQVNATVTVDEACVGRAITSDCGSNDPGGIATGNDVFGITVCANSSCETSQNCTFRVTTAGGIETTAAVHLAFDNIAPVVNLQLIAPPVACGSTITEVDDANLSIPGVQAVVRILAPLTADRQLTHTLPGGGISLVNGNVPGGEVPVTVEPGLNTFRGSASDSFGNTSLSALCPLTLADLAVSFSPPIADGEAGATDGVVNGNELTLDVCGTVSEAGAAVTVAIDGGPAQPATVTGTTWCLEDAVLSEGNHQIVAEATVGPRVGENTLALNVDIAPPPPPTGLSATPLTRQSLQMQWTAPGDVSDATGYAVKVSHVPISEGNFDALPITEAIAGAGGASSPQARTIDSLRPNATVYVAIATLDAAGNRSAIASTTTALAFTKVGPVALAAPVGDAGLGVAMATGRFNADAFDDLAVAAPFEDSGLGRVYVYFGGASGLAVTPGATLLGTESGAQFGNALATVRWSSATMDDLVVGAPLAGGLEGKVYLFRPGVSGLSGVRNDTTANVQFIAGSGWFASSGLGYTLTSARFDGDGVDDLIIGAVAANGFTGGVAVVYGGTVTGTSVVLSDADPSALGGAAVSLINNPNPAVTDFFSIYLHNVGRTQGATDVTDDLLIGYSDDVSSVSTSNNRALLMRGTPARPANNTVEVRAFSAARDVILDLGSADVTTDFAAAASSLQDQNSDGAREVVVSAFREGQGTVYVVDGNVLGDAQGVAYLSNPAVGLARIAGTGAHTMFGATIANNALGTHADVDNDGIEDLVVATNTASGAAYLVWYGGSIPIGAATSASAQYSVATDAALPLSYPSSGGPPGVLLWCDSNGDGLDDLALSSSFDNGRDGIFETLTR